MISLYLKPDETQVVRAEIKKNMTLSIKAVDSVSSYWQTLIAATEEESGKVSAASVELSGLFREVRKAVSASNEEFYVVLPDSLFLMVDCVHESVEDMEKYISGATETPVGSFYYSVPIETRPGAELLRTVYAISSRLVQTIVDAAGEEGATLISIEPASVSFLRAMGEFSRENFMLQAFPDSAQIVAYSPVGGAFRMAADSLSENRLLDMPEEEGNRDIRQTFAQLDMVADRTFPSMNDNVTFIILSDKRNSYMKFDGISQRSVSEIAFPEYIESGIATDEQADWMTAAGTLLQEQGEDSSLYSKKPSFLNFCSANVLPKGIQTNAKLFRISQKAKQVSRVFILSGLYDEPLCGSHAYNSP